MRNLPILIVACLALLAGCHNPPKVLSQPIITTGNALARAGAHVESAQNRIIDAKPFADATGKTLLSVAEQDLLMVSNVDHPEIDKGLSWLWEESNRKDGVIADKDRDMAKVKSLWYVRWGWWIDLGIKIFVIGFVIANVVNVMAGFMGGPLLAKIALWMAKAFPIMNFAVKARNALRARNDMPSVYAVTKAATK